jgi:hypothetical protein
MNRVQGGAIAMQCAFITRGAVEIFPSKMRNSLARFGAQVGNGGVFLVKIHMQALTLFKLRV